IPRAVGPDGVVVFHIVGVRFEVDTDMVSDRRLAGTDFHGCDPDVLRDAAWNGDETPLNYIILRIRWDLGFRTVHDQVRLDIPTIGGPVDCARSVLRVAFRRSAVGPLRDSV